VARIAGKIKPFRRDGEKIGGGLDDGDGASETAADEGDGGCAGGGDRIGGVTGGESCVTRS